MRAVLVVLLAAAAASAAQATRVTRATLVATERAFDSRVEGLDPAAPYMLLGNTRGIYLDGYGVVFTAEVNLVATILTPFNPTLTAADKARIKKTKLERIPVFKQQMRAALIQAGAALDTVPLTEQIVLGVSLFNSKLEDTVGLPAQIVMQAPRKALVDASRGNAAALDGALRVQEY